MRPPVTKSSEIWLKSLETFSMEVLVGFKGLDTWCHNVIIWTFLQHHCVYVPFHMHYCFLDHVNSFTSPAGTCWTNLLARGLMGNFHLIKKQNTWFINALKLHVRMCPVKKKRWHNAFTYREPEESHWSHTAADCSQRADCRGHCRRPSDRRGGERR